MTVYDRSSYIHTDSSLKKDLLKLFNKSDKLIILDVGGCEGEESIRYSRIFPDSSIYIFEPILSNQKLISKNILKYNANKIELIPFAVSDEDGFSQIHVSSGHPDYQPNNLDWNFGNKSSSLLQPDKINSPNWLKFNEKTSIQTITLDSFLSLKKIEEIDFIHMDVQGAELKVLMGAKSYLKNIKTMWLEVSEVELYKNQPLRKDIESFMKSNGFCLVKSEIENKVGDQFYVNKKYFRYFKFFNKKIQFRIRNSK
ncbi:MAG: FkbM family methyltransferase [Flaviramulus sp.]|nr:FkbM family methyltransferase [Flaviramulus sp.]NNC50949.1 FkbM family methyltransferase [Flaviramulus sp.]